MRSLVLAVAAVSASLALLSSAGAAPVAPNLERGLSVGAVIPVAEGCGRGWHWVGGYRDRYGNFVRGRCVPN